MSDDEKPICPNCNEEVEQDWLKCPMCNHQLKTSAGKTEQKPPKSKKAKPEKMDSIAEDLRRSDEARKISEMAAQRAKDEARIKDLKAATVEKEKRIAELQKAIENEKKKAEEMELKLKAVEGSGGDAEQPASDAAGEAQPAKAQPAEADPQKKQKSPAPVN